jgi:hypothetical protein
MANDVDVNFNDDELADIMNEIESLEAEESNAPDEMVQTSEILEGNDLSKELGLDSVEETSRPDIQEQIDQDINQIKSSIVEDTQEKVIPMDNTKKNVQKLHYHLSGDVKLDLQLDYQGVGVQIEVDAEHGFTIQWASGAKMTFPLTADTIKKAS